MLCSRLCLLLITAFSLSFQQAICSSFFKRTNSKSFDLNRTPSPGPNDGDELISNPSHDQTATSSYHLSPIKTIVKKHRHSKLLSLTADQKRERRNEMARTRRKSLNEAYANRMNMPSDSEKRKMVEEKMEVRRRRVRKSVSNYYKSIRDAFRSGNPTEDQSKVWKKRKASSGASRKRRAQKVQEDVATELERDLHQKDVDYQKTYKRTHRMQINAYKKAHYERKKAKKVAESLQSKTDSPK